MKHLIILALATAVGCSEVDMDWPTDTDTDADASVADAGCDCGQPPPRQCVGGNGFRVFYPGDCVDGFCEYPYKTFCCANGCEDGYCLRVCDSPPADHCNGRHELIKYDPIGTLKNGVCFHGHTAVECECDLESGCGR